MFLRISALGLKIYRNKLLFKHFDRTQWVFSFQLQKTEVRFTRNFSFERKRSECSWSSPCAREAYYSSMTTVVVNNNTFPNKHEWMNKSKLVTFMSWVLMQDKWDVKVNVGVQALISAGATIRRTRRLPRALNQRGRQKYNCAVPEVMNIHQAEVNEHDERNGTNVHTVHERRHVQHYFKLGAKGLCLSISISHTA